MTAAGEWSYRHDVDTARLARTEAELFNRLASGGRWKVRKSKVIRGWVAITPQGGAFHFGSLYAAHSYATSRSRPDFSEPDADVVPFLPGHDDRNWWDQDGADR